MKNMRKNLENQSQKRKPDRMMLIILAAFVVSGLVTAFFAFRFVREIISTTEVFNLGGLAIEPAAHDADTPENLESGPAEVVSGSLDVTESDVDFTSRINVLVMGLDYRDWESGEGPARSDTMILLTLDPVGKTAAMLSIPRDLWVNVPGFGQNKINTAYYLGEANRLPGGGPQLASRTVEEFLGIQIHYWAQIDFTAFVQFVDYIGGVKIDIKEPIELEVIGKLKDEKLEPGTYSLDGALALAYARNRSQGDGDFSRAQRQQEVILALRQQLLRLDVQRLIFSNPKGIWDIFSQNIRTNIPFSDAFTLGKLALQINPEQIGQHVISPPDYVTFAYSPEGLDILKPITQNIRILRDEVFTPIGLVGPASTGQDLGSLVQTENARLGVYNGSSISGLAGATQEYLDGINIPVTEIGNGEYVPSTSIYDYTGNPYTVEYLVQLFGIQHTRIFNSYDPNSPIDVSIVLGDDWQVPSN